MSSKANDYHNKFHKIVADISSGFISADSSNIDEKINDMLRRIVEIFSLDRGFLFLFSHDLKKMSNTHEVCRKGVNPVIDKLTELNIDNYGWWKEKIFNKETIIIKNTNHLPQEAWAEREIFQSMDTRSLISLPVIINDSVKGFVGLESTTEYRDWEDEDIHLMQILANTLAESFLKISAEREVERLSKMQSMLMNIASTYINIPLDLVDETIMCSLKEMAEFVEADRSYIFKYDFVEKTTSNTYEWCANDVTPEIENLQNVPIDFFPEWVGKHQNGEAFILSDISTLPYTGPGCLRDILEPQGIKSIITVPMFTGETLTGFIGFDSVKKYHTYTEKERSLLTLFAQMLTNVNQRAETERQLTIAKEQAEAANRAKSEFLANMSHEIRTPLNSVIGFTELLNKTPLNISQKKFVENANISAQSLLEIINDILDFSKIEAGRLELSPIKTDIIEIAEQVCDMVKYQAMQKNLELLLFIQPGTPRYAVVDPIRVKQILVNLISNAIKFTERGEAELKIGFRKIDDREGEFTFFVRDTGIGISQEEQKRLFRAFTQADSSTTRKFGGTGLGLVISNHLASKMGDGITMESALGKGSVFHFSIITNYDFNEEFKDNSLTIKRVLVVDDNKNNRVILEHTLKSWNIEVDSCEDGLEAIRRIKLSAPFDVILIDYKMPLINGLDTIRMLRADTSLEKEKMPAIIMCSSDDDSLINMESKRTGDIYKLIKPVKISELYDYLLNLSKTGVIKEKPRTKRYYQVHGGGYGDFYGVKFKEKPVIVIAEDVQMNMILIKTLIGNSIQDAVIFEARNGKEAVELAFSEDPDLILMDVQMTEMDGLQATESIRDSENGKSKRIPIVALTAGASNDDRERCLNAGMDDYLTKPIEQKELAGILAKYLKGEESVQESLEGTNIDTSRHFDKEEMMARVDNNQNVLTDLINALELEMESTIKILETNLMDGNLESAKKMAHKIKGIALNMSFNNLTEISRSLENAIAAKRHNRYDKMKDLVKEWEIIKGIIYQ